jgi:hypothetical protein
LRKLEGGAYITMTRGQFVDKFIAAQYVGGNPRDLT